jgi:prepilin-type N-terminal cleavage/methylation domain-containing protein
MILPTTIFLRTVTMLHAHDKKNKRPAFTLFELMVVLVIIAAMVTVVLPYATRSNEALKLTQESLSLAEAIRYVIYLASDTRKPTRIIIDNKNNRYFLETASEISNRDFEPIEDFVGSVYYFGSETRIVDISGFSTEGSDYCLTFEPAKPWPNASISLSSGEQIKTVTIKGKHVEIEDSTI